MVTSEIAAKEVLFHLLHIALGGDCVALSEADVDWRTVMDLAVGQGVVAVCFEAVQGMNLEVRPPFELYLEWLGRSDSVKKKAKDQLISATNLAQLWHEKNIRTVVIKGISTALLYPTPFVRQSNDFDCFLCGDYEKGNCIIEGTGVRVDRSDYRHSSFNYEMIHVENHKICTTIRGLKRRKKFERFLQSLLVSQQNQYAPSSFIELPSPLFRALYFLQHAHRHFLREGIQLRYICDWAMIVKADNNSQNGSIFNDEFWSICEEHDLKLFAESMSRLAYYVVGIKPRWLVKDDLLPQDNMLLNDCFEFENSAIRYGVTFRAHRQMVNNMVRKKWKYRYFSKLGFMEDIVLSMYGVLFERNPQIA